MNVSIIIPAKHSESGDVEQTLRGVRSQQYSAGELEVLVPKYDDNSSPYSARNSAALDANGDVLLFTEPACVPDPHWVQEHVKTLRDRSVTISVGRVIGESMSKSADLFISYEDARDNWVFSSDSWQHYFGRPKNMAVARRRFETHGPFVEVMRGADSKLVQRVAREISCNEISFTPDAMVRQSSVHGLGGLMRERFAHARALRMYRSSHAAPIDLEQRIRLFRETVARHGYRSIDSLKLSLFLNAGLWAFRLGGASGSAALAMRLLRQRLASVRDSGSSR